MMNKERRSHELSTIRHFFQDQWSHLGKLLDQLLSADTQETQVSAKIVESVVTSTNARIRIVGNYKKRLRRSIKSLLEYVDLLVMVIPDPIDANPDHFGIDQHLNAFFVSKEHIAETFGSSESLRQFLKDPKNIYVGDVYAILLMSKLKKTVFGSKYSGDMLLRDVKQKSLTFSEHSVQSPAGSKEDLRDVLKQLMVENFISYAKRHIAFLKIEREDKGGNESLLNPENYLHELCHILENPHELFGLKLSGKRVDKMGILLENDQKGSMNELNLREFIFGDDEKRTVVLVKYPRNKMPEEKNMLSEAKKILGTI